MLRVVLIDDEPSALDIMKLLLSEFDEVTIAGMYTVGEKALASIERDKPHAVFVDMEMPGKNGLQIAGELTAKYPKIRIVFVTAYSRYASAASETSAIDYLLKPVRKERLESTITRLKWAGRVKSGI